MLFNPFRYAADICHLCSKLVLVYTIHRQHSAEGVSLLTQSLYSLVFCTRYLTLFTLPPHLNWYNFFFKIFYITSSFYIIFLMLKVYSRSRETEKEYKITACILAFSLLMTPVCMGIFKRHFSFIELCWNFSLILESLAVLPQLTMLSHISIPTVINSYYLLLLGLYRALYIPNWIWRSLDNDDRFSEPVSVIFGVIQTLLYIEFAWIYWRRQKVKLRAGSGVLDNDEFARGLVLGRIINISDKKTGTRTTSNAWRGGGLSVSADDDFVPGGRERDPAELEVSDDSEDELERELPGDVEQGLMGRT